MSQVDKTDQPIRGKWPPYNLTTHCASKMSLYPAANRHFERNVGGQMDGRIELLKLISEIRMHASKVRIYPEHSDQDRPANCSWTNFHVWQADLFWHFY